jgi:Na+/phosphate symporter
MVIAFALLVCLIGLLMFWLASNPKTVEIGKLMFFAGLLAFLLTGVAPLVAIFSRAHG